MEDTGGQLPCPHKDFPIDFRNVSAHSGLGRFEHLFESDLESQSFQISFSHLRD